MTLQQWIQKTGMTQRQAANTLGLTQSQVCRSLTPRAGIPLWVALKVEARTFGQVPAWTMLTPGQRRSIYGAAMRPNQEVAK